MRHLHGFRTAQVMALLIELVDPAQALLRLIHLREHHAACQSLLHAAQGTRFLRSFEGARR